MINPIKYLRWLLTENNAVTYEAYKWAQEKDAMEWGDFRNPRVAANHYKKAKERRRQRAVDAIQIALFALLITLFILLLFWKG